MQPVRKRHVPWGGKRPYLKINKREPPNKPQRNGQKDLNKIEL